MKNVINIPARIEGFFDITIVRYDMDTGKEISRRKLPRIKNLITNGGMDMIAATTAPRFYTACYVGTGNTAPANTDTQLVALVGTLTFSGSIATTAASTHGNIYAETAIPFASTIGGATGNLAEIGVGPASTTLFSRALIKDGSGVPTTLTILSSEQLLVTYLVRVYLPQSDVTGSVTIGSTTYTYTLRAGQSARAFGSAPNGWALAFGSSGGSNSAAGSAVSPTSCFAYTGAIAALGGVPAGTAVQLGSTSSAVAYVSGSYTQTSTIASGTADGNLSGGILSVLVSLGFGAYQVQFSSAIPKDNTKSMSLTFTQSWARQTV